MLGAPSVGLLPPARGRSGPLSDARCYQAVAIATADPQRMRQPNAQDRCEVFGTVIRRRTCNDDQREECRECDGQIEPGAMRRVLMSSHERLGRGVIDSGVEMGFGLKVRWLGKVMRRRFSSESGRARRSFLVF